MPDVSTRPSRSMELVKVDKAVSPETTSKIGGIADMPPINNPKEVAEDTTIGDKIRHRKPIIGDPPSIVLTVFWDPGETPQGDLQTAYYNETEDSYRIRFTDVSPVDEFEFKAYVIDFTTPYAGVGSILQQDFTFQLNENDQNEIVTHNPV